MADLTMDTRALRRAFDAEFDRPITPKLARDLYWIFQAFTALLAGFTATVFLINTDNPFIAVIGFALAPIAWLIATITARMCIELALVIFDLHRRAALITAPINPQRSPIPEPLQGKAIER
jgi:hypothetical protein